MPPMPKPILKCIRHPYATIVHACPDCIDMERREARAMKRTLQQIRKLCQRDAHSAIPELVESVLGDIEHV